MAYEITFDNDRVVSLRWSDHEKQSVLYRKEPEKDGIVIKAEGRNMYSKPFRKNVIYSIYDYLIPKTKRKKFQVIVIFNEESRPIDIIIPQLKIDTPRTAQELFDAIIAVDKKYSELGGGVFYKHKLYQSKDLTALLSQELEKIVQK